MKLLVILRAVRGELAATLRGVGAFYASFGRLVTIQRPSLRVILKHIPVWFAVLACLTFLFGHWLCSAWAWEHVFNMRRTPPAALAFGMLAGGVVLLLVVAAMYVRFAKQALTAKQADARAQIRGALLAPAPFYLCALVCIMWGLNEGVFGGPKETGEMPWMVALNYAIPGKHALSSVVTDPANPALSTIVTAGDGVQWHPLAYWAYVIKLTTTVSLAPVFDGLVFGDGTYCARIYSWGFTCDFAELVIALINASLFLGILGDIALAVQRKIQLGDLGDAGESTLDLTTDYATKYLAGITKLDTLEEVDRVLDSWTGLHAVDAKGRAMLRRRLDDESPTVRATAALALGEIGDREAIVALRACTRDPAARVRSAALVALGRLDPEHVAFDIAEALADPDRDPILAETAARVAPELVEGASDDPAALRTALIETLGVADADVQATVAELLTRFDRRRTVAALVTRLPRAKYDDVWRIGALHALSKLGTERAETVVAEYAHRRHPIEVRHAAIDALGDLEGDAGTKPLRAALRQRQDVDLRQLATDSLGRRGDAGAVDALLAVLDEGDLQLEAIRALGAITAKTWERARATDDDDGDAQARALELGETLVAALEPRAAPDVDAELRDTLCAALAETGTATAVPLLARFCPAPAAALALGTLGLPEALDPLARAAEQTRDADRHTDAHVAPLAALGQLGAVAFDTLVRLYRARKDDRDIVALALARVGHADAVAFLIGQFNEDDPATVALLAPALAATREPEAREVLVHALTANAQSARLAALALGEMGDPAALDPLAAAFDTWDDEVKTAILGALGKFNPDQMTDAVVDTIKSQAGKLAERAQGVFRAMGRVATLGLLRDSDNADADDEDSDQAPVE